MFCHKCGTSMADVATACPSCHAPTAVAQAGAAKAAAVADTMKAAWGSAFGAFQRFASDPVGRLPGTYEALFARGRRLMAALRESLEAAGIPAQVTGEPPAFQPWFTGHRVLDHRSALTADAGLGARFAQLLFDRGVVKAHEKFFLSTAHSDADIDRTIAAIDDALSELRR